MNAIKEMTADDQGEAEDDKEQQPPRQLESSAPTRTLGLTRWVQYVFVVVAVFAFWFLDKVATLVWENFAEPPVVAISAGAGIAAVALTVVMYRQERAHTLVTEVVAELTKVTWPSRKETYASTIVVIITSLIAAFIVGAFDYIWSAITDFLYKHQV